MNHTVWLKLALLNPTHFQAKKGQSRTRTCTFNGATCPTGVSNEPLIETKTCANRIWHGEPEVASYSTNAGYWYNQPAFALKNIFDDDPLTNWHSNINYKNSNKIITINFNVSFSTLIISLIYFFLASGLFQNTDNTQKRLHRCTWGQSCLVRV